MSSRRKKEFWYKQQHILSWIGIGVVVIFGVIPLLIVGSRPANVVSSLPRREISVPEDCFTGGEWNVRFGDLKLSAKEPSYFFLEQDENRGFLGYSEDLPLSVRCEFSFVPRGDSVVNFTLSVDKFYQVLIGDNDYHTVSLAAAHNIEGKLDPIEESATELTRPRLREDIFKGSAVDVTLEQGLVDNETFKVVVSVHYLPDTGTTEEDEYITDSFVYFFKPSPQIYVEPLRFSMGLIRAPRDGSVIAINLLHPVPNLGSQ